MKARHLAVPAIAVAATLVLGGCTATGDGGDNPTTVTMWARAATGGITEALVEKYNASQDDVVIDLTVLPLNQEDQKFAAAVRSGEVPDIFGMNDISIPQFVRTGALRPLGGFVSSLDYADALNPGQMDLASYQEQPYGVPLMLDLSVLWYNKDLFTQAGLDPETPPASAEEIIEAARAISALGGDVKGFSFAGNCGGCNTFTIEPMIFATHDYVVQGEAGEQTVNIENNQTFREVLEMLQTLWNEGLMPTAVETEDGATFGQDFLTGNVGITMNGIGTILAAHDGSFELGIGGIPAPDGSAVSTFAGGDVMVLPAEGEHVEEAQAFMAWVLQPEQQAMYPDHGFTPVRTDVLSDEFIEANPYFAVALEAAANGYAPKTVAFQSIYSNTGPWGPIFQTAVFGGDIDGALSTGQRAVEAVLADLDAE
jgi:multiple sugar transport system substrate-binding protein